MSERVSNTASDTDEVLPEEPLFFGRYCAFPRTRQFLVDGHRRDIGSRAFDLLMVLLQSRGQILSKEDLISRVWPETYVDEVNLRVQIGTVRKALGEDSNLIKTVPGRGYLLAVDEIAAAPAEPAIAPGLPAGTNLPRPLNSLIGRQTELAELEQAIAEARLVTLLGSGGIGKTRLSIELGHRLAPQFDAVRLVDLAPVTDPAAVMSATVQALNVQLRGDDISAKAIAAAIGPQRQLVIFDNCEHLIRAAGGLIVELLTRAPNLSVIATSQVTLGISGERVYRVNPLALPPDEATEVAGFDAVALFVSRAQAADRRFKLDARNAEGVAEICRRLDGIPLALEMAAARLPMLGIEVLQSGLRDRLKMLRSRSPGYEARYASLRAMAEWSHALLDDEEKQIFRRLGIFAGSFSLEAATAVGGMEGSDEWDTVDTLGRLIDKSLVTIEATNPPRYRLLETLRLFALEQLDAHGEQEALARRHAEYFAALLDRAAVEWEQTSDEYWLPAYRPAFDDCKAALEWALRDRHRSDLALRLACGASYFWAILKLNAEGRDYFDRVVPLLGPATAPALAAHALRRAAVLWTHDVEMSVAFAKRSAEAYSDAGDVLGRAGVMSFMAGAHTRAGQFDAAEAVFADCRDILIESNRTRSAFTVLLNTAILACLTNDLPRGRDFLIRALERARLLRDPYMERLVLHNLAELEFQSGAIEQAISRGLELESTLLPDDRRLIASRCSLTSYLILGDKPEDARVRAQAVLPAIVDDDSHFLRVCLEHWAILGALEGRHQNAARLAGFTEAALARSGQFQQGIERKIRDRLKSLLEANLPAAEIEGLAADGSGWTKEQAVSFAINQLDLPGRAIRQPAGQAG